MTSCRILLSAAVTLLGPLAAPALATDTVPVVSDSRTLAGTITSTSPKGYSGDNRFNCHYLDTQPGEVWQIILHSQTMSTGLTVRNVPCLGALGAWQHTFEVTGESTWWAGKQKLTFVAGGGRYDKLIEMFGGPSLPATGFGMGDVVLAILLQQKNKLPATAAATTTRRGASAYAKPVLLIVAVLAVVVWLGRLMIHAYHYVETDDAYVVGHLHQISPQLQNQVKEVLVSENQTVKAGDVLVRLDPLESELAVQKSQAELEQAKAQEAQTRAAAAQADTQIAEATARVEQAKAQVAQTAAQLELARLNRDRNEQLFGKGGVIAQSDLDNARNAFAAAEAALNANQANVTAATSALGSAEAAQKSAHAQIAAASANVSVSAAAVRDAERKLSYTTITAPASGRVGNKSVEPGNYVPISADDCSWARE